MHGRLKTPAQAGAGLVLQPDPRSVLGLCGVPPDGAGEAIHVCGHCRGQAETRRGILQHQRLKEVVQPSRLALEGCRGGREAHRHVEPGAFGEDEGPCPDHEAVEGRRTSSARLRPDGADARRDPTLDDGSWLHAPSDRRQDRSQAPTHADRRVQRQRRLIRDDLDNARRRRRLEHRRRQPRGHIRPGLESDDRCAGAGADMEDWPAARRHRVQVGLHRHRGGENLPAPGVQTFLVAENPQRPQAAPVLQMERPC
mmetsp:Transcript_43065/g.125260  ORF Transcript_43065/g.125260 Transcript_43065/m.125260 type:complete len:255 (+) Transcript_43065:1491-2255(+)